MKLYSAKDSWIVSTDRHSLYFNRRSLSIYSKSEAISDEILTSESSAWDAQFFQDIFGFIGQIQVVDDGIDWLIFIKSQERVGFIDSQHEVFRINDILVLPFHNVDQDSENKLNNKTELKLIEELRLWYQETQCFYYSSTFDLTNTRQNSWNNDQQAPLWRKSNERFFWNRHMIDRLIKLNEKDHLDDRWIQPIMMGYFRQCSFLLNDETNVELILISRRSRYRSGVRMHCRGVDEEGYVANYVETEQIVFCCSNVMSFVMIRGSIPIYWSQPGIRYRPPPKLDRNFNESHQAFIKHIEDELSRIKGNQLILISLVDESGRETILNDAFYDHVIKYNCPNLSFITFDFHEFCKGLQFGNVLTLLELLEEKNLFREMKFFWMNTEGKILLNEQVHLFRINCIDCLDRTNVIQAAIGKTMLEIMLKKIGLLDLDQGGLQNEAKSIFQTMWADNGDAISRQYAGTDAMKGDFTRTGRRDIKGVLADGKISANRYYRRFKKDTLRQQCYDAMQKQTSMINKTTQVSTVMPTIVPDFENNNELTIAREEMLKQIIFDCRKMFVSEDDEDCFGTWLLIDDSDSNEVITDQIEPDCVLVLTSARYFVVCYDETFQKVVSFKETPLTSVEKVEVGPNPLATGGSPWTLRIHYVKDGQTTGYYHQFRGSNVQVFNTTVMFLKDIDQTNDYLKTIGQMIISILNSFAQKSFRLTERTLNRMNSLPDNAEMLQKRMSFTATDVPPVTTLHSSSVSTNNATIDKIKSFGSKFSLMVTRQAAPTLTKLTTQAKQLPINETVTSIWKAIGETPQLMRGSAASGTTTPKTIGTEGDERSSSIAEPTRKRLLQEKFDQRKAELISSQCKTKCFLLPAPDLSVLYIPTANDQQQPE